MTIHNTDYEFYTWQQLGEDIFSLSEKILHDNMQFDRIVALAKGGLTFSRSVVDYLHIPNISSIQIEFYSGINETQKTPVITQSLPVSIKNERVLIFDDIADSGETLALAKKYLQYHGAKSLHTATLFTKPQSIITPDYFVHQTTSWVIFPNEVRETVELLSKKWQDISDSPEQIRQQLVQIGFPEREVSTFTRKE